MNNYPFLGVSYLKVGAHPLEGGDIVSQNGHR